MQSIQKTILTICALSVVINFSMAQKVTYQQGYYILKSKKDTVSGFFDLERLNDNRIRFSTTENMQAGQQILPREIEKIMLDNNIIIMPQILTFNGVEEPVFVTTFLIGKINLFKGASKKEKEVFYISTDDKPELKRINKSDPKTFLKIYFKDCSEVKLPEVFYNPSSLRNAIGYFSRECYGIASTEFKEVRIKSSKSIDLGFRASASLLLQEVKGWYGGSYKNQVKPNIALIARLKLSNSISIGTGLSYYSKKYETRDSLTKTIYSTQGQASFYTKMLITDKVWEVPFEITYLHYQTEKPYKPFISFAYSLWQPSNFTRNNDYKGLLMSPFGVKNGGFSNLALSATFGFRKSIKETASIEFGMRYAFERERVDNIVEISEYNLTNNQNASGDLNKLYLNDYNLLQTHRISLFFNYLFVFQKKNK